MPSPLPWGPLILGLALAAAGLGPEGAPRQVTLTPFAADPNRARMGAFADLAIRLLLDLRRKIGRGPARFTPEAISLLGQYSWPGNIRELRNVLERTIVLSDSPVLTEAGVQAALHLSVASSSALHRPDTAPPPAEPSTPPEAQAPAGHAQAMNFYERQLIERALADSPTVAGAAKKLGIGRATLYRKMAAYRLGRWRPPAEGVEPPSD